MLHTCRVQRSSVVGNRHTQRWMLQQTLRARQLEAVALLLRPQALSCQVEPRETATDQEFTFDKIPDLLGKKKAPFGAFSVAVL